MTRKIIYASDYRGIELRKELTEKSREAGFDVKDIGIPDGSLLDYVDISKQLAEELRIEKEALGIMVCGSGQGVAIALNRFTHIRAGMCRTVDDSVNIREKLNANVMTLGSKQTTPEEAFELIEAFIQTPFEAGKHNECVQKLDVQQTKHALAGINLIVRAMIIHEGHILLTTATESNRDFAQNLYFLPGGHVDYKEPSLEALKRELWEEMKVTAQSAEFKGALECSWDRKGSIYHEINFVYQVDIDGLSLEKPPVAVDHSFHKFVWVPLDTLEEIVILPETLKPLIVNALKDEKEIKFFSQMLKDKAA